MKSFNRFRIFFAILMFTVLLGSIQVSFAQDSGLVTVQSKASFDKTVESLRKMVSQNQMMVLAEVNHGKILSMTGLKFNGISLFLGNPTIGKKLFTANKALGLAVPIRVNIYQDTDGKTYVNYIKPSRQLANFSSKPVDMIAKKLDEKLQKLTSMLAQ